MSDDSMQRRYEIINGLMRVLGVEQVLRSGSVTPVLPYARPAKFGISEPEVAQVLSEMKDFDDWALCWGKWGERHELIGRKSAAENQAVTARDAYIHASYVYHLAQVYARERAVKRDLHQKSVEMYRAAAPYFVPPISEMRLEAQRVEIPGYFRAPDRAQGVSLVVMLDGADTTKEEAHYQADAFVQRGMAVFYFDGPGQGELRETSKVKLGEYEEAVSQLTDLLLRKFSFLNQHRVGIYGISTGGYLALRSAARDDRFRAIASVGGFYDARGYLRSPAPTQESMRSLFGMESVSEMTRFIQEEVSLAPLISKIHEPTLLVYGTRDHLVPKDEIQDLKQSLGNFVTMKIFEGGTHALQNVDYIVRPLVADWMVSTLSRERPLSQEYLDHIW